VHLYAGLCHGRNARQSDYPRQCERCNPEPIARKYDLWFPEVGLTRTLRSVVDHDTYKELRDLRDVRDLRGDPPRGFVATGDPNVYPPAPQVAELHQSPRDFTRGLPYGWTLNEGNVRSLLNWVESSIERILSELEPFATARARIS
jgi:hypothetical protein